MGGIGSGNWYRWNKQTTVEQSKRIDIRYLNRDGVLYNDVGYSGKRVLHWSRGDEPAGHIDYYVYPSHILLRYRFRQYGEEWEPVEQKISLTQTECHFGGSRQWFLCPCCHNRVAILCGEGKYFFCRKCYDLPYSSQIESDIDRLIRKKEKIGNKIFKGGEPWQRKKGLHKSTFNRELEKYWELDDQIDVYIENYLSMT